MQKCTKEAMFQSRGQNLGRVVEGEEVGADFFIKVGFFYQR